MTGSDLQNASPRFPPGAGLCASDQTIPEAPEVEPRHSQVKAV